MIEVEGLKKRFALANPAKLADEQRQDPRQRGRYFHSVESVHLRCSPGEVTGLVGPNGAGKTTTLRMLSGVLEPDQGSIRIFGQDLQQAETRRQIGFLSGTTNIYPRLTVAENLLFFAQLYGLDSAMARQRLDQLCGELDLDTFRNRRVMDLSTGMKQRANIARAVIHEPRVLVFDEPTTGLDIMATQTILAFIEAQKALGCAVIFSTHHLEEVSLICDRLSVIHGGRTVFDGDIEGFAGDRDTRALHQRCMTLFNQAERTVAAGGAHDCTDLA